MNKTFVITGRPGSGKSVQAKVLSEKTGYKIFSPGQRYREIATEDSAFGKKIKETIDSGRLGPHWLSSFLFQEVILNIGETDGIIFEGIGRKEEEARMFNDTVTWLGRPYVVLNIVVDEDAITRRLNLRRETESREDDDPEDIPVRIKEYDMYTKPAIDFFKAEGRCVDINGDQPVEAVHNEIIKKLNL
ncbi:MAG: nucleoside monophosphate kinase [Candidatus Paceibacterota bacterium]